MDDNLRTPTFEYDSNDPFVLSSPTSEFELLELLWKKGPVEKPLAGQLPPGSSTLQSGEFVPFITEDEMAMWLHYPTEDANDATLRDACDRPMLEQTIKAIVPGTEMQIGDDVPCAFEEHVGSSTATRTKRKLNERTGLRVRSEVATIGTGEKRQDHPESVSSRKSHKAKVHNLSERRRRERINEKLKALQELIPRSNKSDKASMLGEAIGYVKSLQNQVQMMSSMGCSMRPMLFPGAPPCMPPMAMGMPMNMGMNMNMGMGMPSFGPVLPCTQFNRPPMMPLQNQQDMASLSMFVFQHARPPCPFPFVVPGPVQVQPKSSGSNINSGTSTNCHDKTEKGKQVQNSNNIGFI